MSGSPVYDEDLRGIVGVLVAVKKGFYATEFVHLVDNWRAGRRYFTNFKRKPNFVAEYTANATLWRALAILGILIVILASILRFKSGPDRKSTRLNSSHL